MGKLHWFLDLVKDYGAKVPAWYAGQCPLVEDGKVVLGVGGSALIMAVDVETGDVLWQTPNPKKWEMTHSSIVPVEFAGTRMYVWCASGGVVGVAAEDGKPLWEPSEWQIRIANTSPRRFRWARDVCSFSGGYNAGAMMLKLAKQDDRIVPEIEFRLAPEVFGSPQHTPILYEGTSTRPSRRAARLPGPRRQTWSGPAAARTSSGWDLSRLSTISSMSWTTTAADARGGHAGRLRAVGSGGRPRRDRLLGSMAVAGNRSAAARSDEDGVPGHCRAVGRRR
jgi:hypothetical protein